MDQAIKKTWTAALRSGEYQQCSGSLTDGVGFCCIGVLGDIQGLDWRVKFSLHTVSLPIEGLHAGLTDRERSDLASMNDGRGDFSKKTFAEIADYIDANL